MEHSNNRIFKVFRFQDKTVSERENELKNSPEKKTAEQVNTIEQKKDVPEQKNDVSEQKEFRIENTKIYHRIENMTPVEWKKFMENYDKRYSYVDSAVGEYGKILKQAESDARIKWIKSQSKSIANLFVKQKDLKRKELKGLGPKPELEKESHNIFGHTYYTADGESYRNYSDYRNHQNSLISKWKKDYEDINNVVNYWTTAINELQAKNYYKVCDVIICHFSKVWNQVKDGGNRLLDTAPEFESYRKIKKIVETLKPKKDLEYKEYNSQQNLEKTNNTENKIYQGR